MTNQNHPHHRQHSSAAPQGHSPLRERAEAIRDFRAGRDRAAAVLSAEERIGVALAELIEAGVNPMRLDLLALAERGQRLRRARAL